MNRKTLYGCFTVFAGILMVVGVSSCNRANLVQQAPQPVAAVDTELDLEIRRVMEKGNSLEERKAQIPAIAAAFARRTDPERARWLAALCYLKTLGTKFSPIDIAEIALVETGGHGLSGRAVSHKGALGVWQLMPHRAASHGYSPEEMLNDEKCAEAAVRELASKLAMANGNLVRAKKLYCGVGPQADAYEVKRRQIRKEILADITKAAPQRAELRYRIERPS
ncbi:transglycosylase SLT domain-containing protein [Geobacter pelophilus]|uniref:Transglycosylase SLT domain-containing protein n=2 Tax=Geoanaerobacter pelophilus TaxID=60036 RepID=A0AAW4L071_9BACT|nr:transglycosylase SLT domain-containing protein [Geoanaerobacter pelophilus]